MSYRLFLLFTGKISLFAQARETVRFAGQLFLCEKEACLLSHNSDYRIALLNILRTGSGDSLCPVIHCTPVSPIGSFVKEIVKKHCYTVSVLNVLLFYANVLFSRMFLNEVSPLFVTAVSILSTDCLFNHFSFIVFFYCLPTISKNGDCLATKTLYCFNTFLLAAQGRIREFSWQRRG